MSDDQPGSAPTEQIDERLYLQSVARTFRVLEALATTPRPPSLRELAQRLLGPSQRPQSRAELMEAISAALRGRSDRAAGDEQAWKSGRGTPTEAREPRPEGHLVARVVGEEALRDAPHVLAEDHLAEPPPDETLAAKKEDEEGLGELPWAYEDDAVVVLPRDPETLWVYWDFAHPTVQESMRGLDHPHAKLRIFERGRLVREYDFALESRSFYVSDLTPGLHYRAEIYFVGTNGQEARVGRASNTIGLPPRGPSPIIDDRFVTLAWGAPLSRRHDLFARAVPSPPTGPREALPSAGRPLGASENARSLRPGPDTHAGGGSASGRPWSGSRYEGS